MTDHATQSATSRSEPATADAESTDPQSLAHAHTDPVTRRQLLALDAARRGDRELSDRLFASPVEGEPDAEWRVEWATGPSRLAHSLRSEDVEFAAATTVIDGRPHAVVGGPDELVRLWDLATGEPAGESLTGHEDDVLAVATTVVDGRPHAVTGDMDGAVRVWDLATGEPAGEPLTGHDGEVNGVATALVDGRPHAVTVGEDETARVWDLTTGRQVGEPFTDHSDHVRLVATTVIDERPHAVTGSEKWGVLVWDLSTGETVRELITDTEDPISAVATAVIDGRPHAITAGAPDEHPGDDDAVSIWDLTEGQEVGTLTGDTDRIRTTTTMVIDGRPHLITGGRRGRSYPTLCGTVRVWDLTTFQQAGRELLFPMPVHTVTAANGRLVVGFGDEAAALRHL
ncbi:hypothetical protein [Streptomyces sp. NBC_01508]|uniref:hypothetical protein n=1 Tax=Streptomyces sp. NBC_01508 TaxID=2903888 RepID=UPI003869425D